MTADSSSASPPARNGAGDEPMRSMIQAWMATTSARARYSSSRSLSSVPGQVAVGRLVPGPALLEQAPQLRAQLRTDLERADLDADELPLAKLLPLDLGLRDRHDVAVADLANLLMNHMLYIQHRWHPVLTRSPWRRGSGGRRPPGSIRER